MTPPAPCMSLSSSDFFQAHPSSVLYELSDDPWTMDALSSVAEEQFLFSSMYVTKVCPFFCKGNKKKTQKKDLNITEV